MITLCRQKKVTGANAAGDLYNFRLSNERCYAVSNLIALQNQLALSELSQVVHAKVVQTEQRFTGIEVCHQLFI